MDNIIGSEPFILTIIFAWYYVGLKLQRKSGIRMLHPLLTAIAGIIFTLGMAGIDYPVFEQGGRMVHFMLGPCVVAIGYLLHKQIAFLKGNVASILSALFIGSIAGVVLVVGILKLGKVPPEVVASLMPKSVTTPIALGISESNGGIPALTAIIVVASGILGSMVGPWLMDKLGIKSALARGLALGAASHGIGTARAMEMGPLEGAIGGMAIGLMGIFTAIVIPLLNLIW